MSVTFSNTYTCYIKNEANQLYCGTIVPAVNSQFYTFVQKTGWHFIPNSNWCNWVNVRQWTELMSHRSFIPASCKVTVQNLIPLTDDLSIAQDTTFMSFNNTIYALTYQDDEYFTSPNEESEDIYWREGVKFKQDPGSTPSVVGKSYLPVYNHRICYVPVGGSTNKAPAGLAWDPMTHSHKLGELRPGKNAVTFSWSRNNADNDNWLVPNCQFQWNPLYNATDNLAGYEDFSTSYYNNAITPGQMMKQYPNTFVGSKQGVEYTHFWKYPIPNMFIKMLPIFGTKNNLLKHEGLVIIHKEITFNVRGGSAPNNIPKVPYHYLDRSTWYTTPGETPLQQFKPLIQDPSNIGQPLFDKRIESNNKIIPTTTTPSATTTKPTVTMATKK